MRVRQAQRRADAAAATFDSADFVHARAREALLERLGLVGVDAGLVVDLGTATGAGCRLLSRRFRGARVVGVDVSGNMLREARRKQRLFSRRWFVQADATRLPFADDSVDVVFSNLLLPWLDSPPALFAEISRILRRAGLFAFSALGPDSLAELRRAWQGASGAAAASPFPDMHDLGDAAVLAGLADPVLDVDRLTISYRDAQAALAELDAIGAGGGAPLRRGLVGQDRVAAMLAALNETRVDGRLNIGIELVYGLCWGSGRTGTAREVTVHPAKIARRQR